MLDFGCFQTAPYLALSLAPRPNPFGISHIRAGPGLGPAMGVCQMPYESVRCHAHAPPDTFTWQAHGGHRPGAFLSPILSPSLMPMDSNPPPVSLGGTAPYLL